jgi:hypothetical protein
VLGQSRNFCAEPESQLVHCEGDAAVHVAQDAAGSQDKQTLASADNGGDTAVATAFCFVDASLAVVWYILEGHDASHVPDDVAEKKTKRSSAWHERQDVGSEP